MAQMTLAELNRRLNNPGPNDVSWIGGLLEVTCDGARDYFYWGDHAHIDPEPDDPVAHVHLDGDAQDVIALRGPAGHIGYAYFVSGRGVIHRQ